ncbi:MAG: PIN domain-containing protein [Pseudomonadota bacterium]
MGRRVFLDACVLFPPVVRSILMALADEDLFEPYWSPRVLDEWRLTVVRKHGLSTEVEVETAQRRMAARFPDASGLPDPDFEAQLQLPDPADTHVLAAAHAVDADVLLTFNLRDFPRPVMAGLGIAARHPDEYLWELLSKVPDRAAASMRAVLDQAGIAKDSRRKALKRARLSRTGKALEALDQGLN